ncbi:hypothetical protein M233_02075 [Xylella fastidiosa subsp. multiplex Griffin-1]|nr:hypothetical protein M233_02075 [Xylella fastidiosa subsp. multiplex Griffin-1]
MLLKYFVEYYLVQITQAQSRLPLISLFFHDF